eukprot:2361158-Pyramimonas_sp.AAC.1
MQSQLRKTATQLDRAIAATGNDAALRPTPRRRADSWLTSPGAASTKDGRSQETARAGTWKATC